MTFEEQAKKISIFFFFALLDESLAAQASERAVSSWKAARGQPSQDAPSDRSDRVALISHCRARFEKESEILRKRSSKDFGSSAPGGPGSPWRLDPEAKMSAWIKFSSVASDEERLAMAFVRILRFAEDEVAEGLTVSPGTLRHRLGRAARSLGAAVRKAEVV